MINKLAVILLPSLLCAATLVDSTLATDDCFHWYEARCCALGDGENDNSGFTPGQKTLCHNPSLGSDWYCPQPNPPLSTQLGEKNESVVRHIDCATGQANCQKQWRTLDDTVKCKARRYTCSTTMWGVCSADPEDVEWCCKKEEVFGELCFVYDPPGSEE